jgi:energy-coupling factor transport system ATP-binding protein
MSDGAGLTIDDLRVRYLGRREPALEDVSVAVPSGSVVSVAGRTGAGKSTLALAGAGFVPRVVRAEVRGSVVLDGIEATRATLAQLAGKVGVVFSAPALQLSASKPTVREELAFGLENLAVAREEMDGRIDAVLERLGIGHLAGRDPLAISGGEQQRVAIASILVMGTRLIVMDEPAAQLDPGGTEELASMLAQLAGDGRAVLVTEHAPEVLAVAQECLVLEAGRVIARGAPAQALGSQPYAPTMVRLAAAAGVAPQRAFETKAVADALRNGPISRPTINREPQPQPDRPTVRGAKAEPIEVRGLVHRYPGGVTALRGVDLTIAPGETVAIVGQNGSGKTTLAKHFNGLLRPEAGNVSLGGRDLQGQRVSDIAGQVGFVFQNPDDQLFNSRVDREVGFGPRNLRLPTADVDRLVEVAVAMVGLTDQRATNPYDLGFSLRKLVALASVLAMEPPILVLDEPTTGQDGPGLERVGSIVDAWAGAGRTVVAITHDMEFAARHFGRVVVMRHGEIVLDDAPGVVFSAQHAELLASTGLRPPPAARIAALLGLDVVPADADELLRLLLGRSAAT